MSSFKGVAVDKTTLVLSNTYNRSCDQVKINLTTTAAVTVVVTIIETIAPVPRHWLPESYGFNMDSSICTRRSHVPEPPVEW